MNELKTIQAMGFSLPTPAYLFGAFLFGILGLAAYRYGRKTSLPIPKWLGVALMLYPYAISSTGLLYAVGVALCIGVYLYRR